MIGIHYLDAGLTLVVENFSPTRSFPIGDAGAKPANTINPLYTIVS